ncbi:Listeria/Bacterioides repeat [Candidatus Nanopelagicaceae bacterium]
MILEILRRTYATLRKSLPTSISWVLVLSLFVAIPSQVALSSTANAAECSPTITTASTSKVITFSAVGSCSWTVPSGVTSVDVLVVGGGASGSAGISNIYWPSGGGGGAVETRSALSVTSGNSINVVTGDGGDAPTVVGALGNNGTASTFGTITVNGGSTTNNTKTANAGAKGGTSGNGNLGATGTASGINCSSGSCGTGGGGGAGGVGSGLNGGSGVFSDITGTSVGYGGGGAGGNGASGTASSGGAVGYYAGTSASATGNGTPNTGGGGARAVGGAGGAGGSGVVIVRYSIPGGSSYLNFDSNGGTGTKAPAIAVNGSSTSLPDETGFSLTGFDFNGWNTEANGSGASYATGSSITISTNTTLYAQWTRIPSPTCVAGVGKGGPVTSTIALTKAGNGCVAITYQVSGVSTTTTFNYTGADQSWTVPSGVTSATFFLIGAGGGGNYAFGGGGGGFATGTYPVTAGQILKVIVGQGGGGAATAALTGVSGYPGIYTPLTYGGGGRGGSFSSGWNSTYYSAGGGRSAVRLPSATTDLATAGGGGGAAYSQCGYGGGGTTGNGGARGGTQTAGGTGASSGNGYPGTNGVAYLGGDSKDEGGGGGGGFYGGGGGGDNTAGGGGSSYVALLTNGTTTSGGDCGAAPTTPGIEFIVTYDSNTATSGSVPSRSTVAMSGGTLTLATNSGTLAKTNYTFGGWNTAADGSGTTYAVSATTYVPSSDATLYAQWNSTITYNVNGGSGAASPTTTTAKGTAANTTLASQGTLTKSGANFSGWNTSADGTGTNYAAGLTTYASAGNITLYAQWTVPTGTPTLAAGSDLGTSSTDKITKDNTPTINVGTVVSGSRVVITATSSTGVTYTCTVESATVTSSCTFPPMADGTYSFTVTQTYNGATSSASTALAGVVIDATAPTVTLASTQIVSGGNALATQSVPGLSYTITATFSEAVSGFVIGDVTFDSASTAWAMTTSALTNATQSQFTFVVNNSTGTGNTPGKLLLRILSGVASDVAGNTNEATASDFVINTIIQLTLTNEYQQSPLLNPVVGGNNALVAQASNGAGITLPGQGTLTRAGHTFAGWSTVTTNGSGAVLASPYVPTVPIKLYSSWTPNVYVVSFDANGGTGAPDSATVNYTYGTAGLAATSTYNKGTLAKTGYTFAGWSATVGGAAVATTYVPTGSITLYARWTAGTFAVTYDSNTATSGTLANLSITAGTAATLSASTTAFSKPGYTFNGWNTLADGSGTSYAASASVTFYANTTLYAKWKIVAPAAPTVSAVSAGNTTVAVTVVAAAVSGTTSGATDSFTVQAYDNAGTLLTGKTCTVLASASPLTCTVSGLTNGTIYKFKTTAFNSTGSAISAAFSSTATPAPYTVIYNINGGTSGAISNGSHNLGTPLTLPTPSRTNYTFSGWYDTTTAGTLIGVGGASYSPSTSVTIYARWVGVSYTITYYSNGATSGTVPAAGSFTAGGSAYPVSDNTGILARTGYTFGGWDTSTAGNGTAYAVNASYSANANLNLYAKWTPVARTVTYAGTKTSGDLPAQLTNKYIGETFTASSASGFARTGFAFTGWSDGTNTYAAGATYTISSTDVTLTAQWAGVSYSITYLANGGSGTLPTQSNLCNGETFTVGVNSLTKTGYSFVAWNDGSANYAPGATYTMSAANTSLIAQWTATGYAITFDGNGADGGSAPTTGRYVTGGAPYSVALNTYTKTGYNFTGWKTSAAVDYAPGSGYASTADLVLIAQWTPKTIAISYNINGGSGTAPASQNWTYNASTPADLDPGTGLTKTGYTLGGWASSANATSGSFTGTPSSSLTYYAVWTPVTYAITYTAGTNGTGIAPTQTGKTLGSTFTLASGSGISRPDESGVSFSFAYWSDGGTTYASGATFLMPARDVTLVANWIAIYNVTYNANGGVTNNASVQKTESATVTIGDAPTRDGYTFGKWVAQSGEQFDPGASTTVQNNRYLFTATWTAIPRSVTYDLNGGSGSAPSTVTGKTIGQIVTLDSTTATKAGYTFGGWSIGGTTYPAGASYTIGNGNVVPVAVWNAATYSLSYNGNGATGGTVPGSGTFTTGGSYTASSNTGILAKTGFTFAGWNTTANGDGTSYAEGATNVTATADLILYAKWTAASFAVTYVANGATSTLPTQSAVQFGNTFTVAPAATQAGKTFTGWSDNTNTYGGGSTYTMGGAAVTLTATWANQLFAITYSLNGGTGASAPTQGALSSSDTFTVQSTSATKAGYSFGGWSNGTNTYQANASYNMTTTNVTLTAIWNVAVPGTPGTPTVSAGDGNATITIAAPTSGGAPTSYTVTASPGGATCTVISPATSCTITGLTNGTNYSFAAVANNATGSSSASPSSAAVSPAGKPGVPTGVTATIGNGSATVSLTPPTNTGGPAITSYTMTASPGGATCTVNAPATSCAISPLDNGTAYTFTATAYNGVARSDSSTASASVTPATVPGAPTITSATSSSSGSTTVDFSAPASNGGSAITGYTITSNPGGFTCTAAANATSCAVGGLTDGVAYTFTAVATNVIGNSSSSGASSSVTSAGTASAPTSISGTVGNGSSTITVSGANANGSPITGYTVQAYDSTGLAISGKTCSITAPATSCQITGLTNGSEYTFTATATNGVGTSAASAPSATVTPAGVPSAPTGVTATSGTGKVTVEWTAPAANGAAITSYTAQAYDPDGNAVSGATCTISAPSTSCDVSTNLAAGTAYTFKVTATNAAGTGSASTASSSAAINAAPSAPRNVTGTASNGSVAVSWDAPSDSRGSAVTGYTVTAYTAGNIAAGTCTAVAPTETCSVTGLTNGQPYTFKVTATNGIGTSAQSTASAAVKPSTVPSAPTSVVASAGEASASISFTVPATDGGSPITGYIVTASDGTTASGTSSPIRITGLTNETAYTFTVKATNANGDSVASSASASATPKANFAPIQTSNAQPSGLPYVGTALTSQVTFSGAPTPALTYQWKVCDDPTDVTTCSNISGATSASFTPTISEEGKYIVVATTATNSIGTNTVTSQPTLVINPEIIYSAPISGLSGTAGSAFVLSVVAAGGVAPFAYSVSSGTLPSGVSLDPSTGQLSGTPATAGSYTFAVRATDSNTAFKTVNVTLTIEAAASSSSSSTSSSSSSSSSTPTPTTPPACDAACQAAKDARAAADKATADANAKAAADATAKAATDKAAADKAAADAAAKAQNTAQTKAAADAAAAVQAAADAAAKAAEATAAKAEADRAAAAAAAAIKAAQAAAAANKPGTSAATATAAATKAAADAQAAVKAAAAAAAAATAAKKQVDISLSVSVSASAKAADSAAAQKQANAVAAAAKAAAEAAAAQAVADASAARVKASQAATAAAEAQAAAVAEKKAAAQAAADAQAAAKAASLAAIAKAAADQAAQKAASELAKALADKAAQSAKVAESTDPTTKAAAQTALAEVSKKVEELTVVAAATSQQFEAKAKEVVVTLAAANEAVETAKQKSEDASQAAQTAAAKVSAATQAAKVATNTTAAAAAATAVAKSLPTTVKIAPAPVSTSKSTDGNGTKATITGLKPGQKIKVTVKVK